MRNILVIFLKELKRVFLDKRMLLSLFLPGILIYFVYSIMGNVMSDSVFSSTTKNTTYEVVYTDNYSSDENKKEPQIVQYLKNAIELTYDEDQNTVHATSIPVANLDEYIEKLKASEIHLLISFTDDFENKVKSESIGNNITIRYNGESNVSNDIYTYAIALVETYNNYSINSENGKSVDPNVGNKDIGMMKVMSFIIPMVTISLLFSTIVSLCPEAIAGEKERGTLAALLLTPIKRREFALGKILSLSVLAIASGATSFLGLILSVPKLMGEGFNLSFAPIEVVLLFLLVISVLLLFIGLGVYISSLANTIKEAAAFLSPIMILFMLFGIVPSLLGADQLFFAFIPILNVCAAVNNLLLASSNLVLFFTITVVSNVVYTGILIFLITKAFEKERIVLGQ